ncbi:MAG TPA: biotin--[acetyl-CoA-carboxylase] ligase [Candidatus Kapabacteria bacterium]|nr:biotin--[acetyl-CoA-carboxylase] ligase [Candidatus Kapabacteria bacterium]
MTAPLTFSDRDPNQDDARQWGIPRFAFFETVDSTQTVLRTLAEEGAPAWTLVVANHQTAGRGQHGRRWHAQPGTSLMFSLLLRPASPEKAALLPIRVGLGAARALDRFLSGRMVALKWPNDLMLNGGKVGGVLCEAQTRSGDIAVVVGVGINVRRFVMQLSDRDDIGVSFLEPWLAPGTARVDLLRGIIEELRAFNIDAATLGPEEIEAYDRRDWLAGRELRGPVAGIARGVDASGHLLVESRSGATHTVIAGRVELAD